jgi:ABC-type sulfate/molybdate transport systems ATPase subunit
MDVRRNIALPLHYHYRDHIGPSQIEARCDAVLTDMELLHLGQTGIRPVALHRQERLYVSLARALVCDPVLLLLDDPVATLSPAAAHRLCRYCFVYHPAFDTDLPDVEPRRPRTRLVTCSDLGPYLDFGDRFLLLVDGRLEEIGTRTDVLTSSDPRVRALQSASATASMAEETVGG